jgi:hypothetical protein
MSVIPLGAKTRRLNHILDLLTMRRSGKNMRFSKKKTADEKYSDKESKRRFEAALRGARVAADSESPQRSATSDKKKARRPRSS